MRPGYVNPIEDVTAMQSEFPDEFALGSAVAVTEGVAGVQFAHVVRGMEVVDKIRMVKTGKKGMSQDVPLDPVLITKAVVIKP